jgi:hypothetical protein
VPATHLRTKKSRACPERKMETTDVPVRVHHPSLGNHAEVILGEHQVTHGNPKLACQGPDYHPGAERHAILPRHP